LYAQVLIQEAEALGAQFIYDSEVTCYPWNVEGDIEGVVVRHSDGRTEELLADVVVLTSGVHVSTLVKKAGYVLKMEDK
jgi:flavin-dependent dehydrogenase